MTTLPAHMLPGPGGLTTDSGKSDTFTKHRLNNEIMNASLKGHFGENKAEFLLPLQTGQRHSLEVENSFMSQLQRKSSNRISFYCYLVTFLARV